MQEYAFTITRAMIKSQPEIQGLTPTQRARLTDCIGPLQVRDEYKRVYKVGNSGDWFYQVENDQQRDKRMGVRRG